MEYVQIGGLEVSRFILGSNPFSGFSHQNAEANSAMVHYYTTERIKATIREAESLGVNTIIGRVDHHMMRVMIEYWDEGGKIQWLVQTCPELASPEACVSRAAQVEARACYLHGGMLDQWLAQGRMKDVPPLIDAIREHGLLTGVAGHDPGVFKWAEQNIDVDFYMCCYYNPARRDELGQTPAGSSEWFHDEDRRIMTELIATLSKPVIHYKIMAAGRNDPAEAFEFAARHMRPDDAVCVGVYPKGKPDMLREDVALLEKALS